MKPNGKTLSDVPAVPDTRAASLDYRPGYAPAQAMIGGDLAIAEQAGEDYKVHTPYGETRLNRDIDFGVIPGTKQPSLYKAGAEKLAMAYGLLQHYSIESMYQDFVGDAPIAFYLVKCELVKIAPNGQEYVFTTGYGSANTREKRNGRSDAFNSANSTIKMAQKRALTAAALSISGLSSMFTQDMEAEDFVNSNIAALSATNREDAQITRKQMNLIYAKAGNLGLTAAQAKKVMSDAGYPSVKALRQRDFQAVLDLFLTEAEKEARKAHEEEDTD